MKQKHDKVIQINTRYSRDTAEGNNSICGTKKGQK